jgi:hypothetical protein
VFTKLTYSTATLAVFLIYFLTNFIWDSQSISDIKEVTIGTSGGVIFSIVVGCSSSISIGALSKCFSKDVRYVTLTKYAIFLIILITLLLILKVFFSTISNIRSDIFLIEEQMGLYQRPGKIMLMLYILVCTLFAFMQQYIRNHTFWNLSVLGLLVTIAATLITYSQLIGSNSGSVTVACIMLVVLCFWFIIGTKNFWQLEKPLQLQQMFSSWVTRTLALYLGLFLTVIFMSIPFFEDFDFSQFRIFGFGSGSNSSIDSRLSLLKNNFVVQLSYSPILGNTKVDDLTTGSGTYTHSLISLLTHLGLIGTGLFLIMVFFIYRDIYTCQNVCDNYYHTNKYAFFRLCILTIIMLFALLTTFYTWMPLWFVIGLLGISFRFKESYHL